MAKYKAPPGVTEQTAEFLKKVASLNLPPTLTLTPAQAREQVERGLLQEKYRRLPSVKSESLEFLGQRA